MVTGATHVYLRQRYRGLPVYNAQLQVHVNTGNNMFLVVVNDKDAGSPTNTSTFRNVRIFEETPRRGGTG